MQPNEGNTVSLTDDTETELHSCKTCKKVFNSEGHLRIHERLHSGERAFLCEHCGEGFPGKEELNLHVLLHCDKKAFSCSDCSRSYKTSRELRKHERLTKTAISKRQPNEHVPIQCEHCSYMIKSRNAKRLHARVHMKKECPYVCRSCKMSFQRIEQLGHHQKDHRPGEFHATSSSNEERFDCAICRRSYKTKKSLKDHLRRHAQPKIKSPFACHRCHRSFRKSSILARHLTTHFEMDPFGCDMCDREFDTRACFDVHECAQKPDVKPKPVVILKYLADATTTTTTHQTILASHPSTSDNEEGTISTHSTIQNAETATGYQQQLENTVSPTELQSSKSSGNTGDSDQVIILPIDRLGAGKKPIIIVKFRNTKAVPVTNA